MRISPVLAVFSLVFLTGHSPIHADDYLGADAILKQADLPSGDARDASGKPDPVPQFHLDLKTYQTHAAALPPDLAAREWLALFDRAVKLPDPPNRRNYYGQSIPARLLPVFNALPPPSTWDALAVQVAARPLPPKQDLARSTTPVLRIVTGMLQGDHAAVRQIIAALKKPASDPAEPSQSVEQLRVQALEDAFLTLTSDQAGTLANFEAKMARLQSGKAAAASDERPDSLEIPDLITLAGEARAEALLKRAFTLDVRGVSVRGERTTALARRVALAMGDQLKFAPWTLVDTLDATALYELLDKHFPGKSENETDRPKAEAYYLLGLIAQGRTADAAAVAVKIGNRSTSDQNESPSNLPEQALSDLAAKGYAKEVYRFFGRLLTDHPELPYWTSYTEAAVLAGETDAMLASVKAAGERSDLPPRVKQTVREAYGKALLAADHVAEALPILREQAKAEAAAPVESSRGRDRRQTQLATATRLARLGQLLGDETLRNEQLDAAVQTMQAQNDDNNRFVSSRTELSTLFLAAGRGPQLERLLAGELARAARQVAQGRKQSSQPAFRQNYLFRTLQEPLAALVDLYDQAGRPEDIVRLLDHASGWGAADLAGLLSSFRYGYNREFVCQLARALQKTGNAAAALRLVNAELERHGGNDSAYALLLALLPPDQAEARLNALFQGDQFEERPLIWRAFLQLGQNRLDEAEKSARQAISIDPSDGEEGRGDRMRGYAVLGDILERKGDAEKAKQMRQAVQAIRLSEDADQLHSAGLLTRAVDLYKKALGYFSDAYCIQSRLAIQLTALGKLDEAATHYERAYELMPESFGRMESHCFGCERAFKGARAEATAERVFQRFVVQQPDNPRVHYLLGYLRGEQDRYPEAAQEYRQAVRLDPDYINAWKQLAATTDDPADRDHAALNLLRLDPQRKHDSADLTTVSDLRSLWAAVEATAKFAPPKPDHLYPLAASKALLEQDLKNHPQKPGDDEEDFVRSFDQTEPLTPPSALLKNMVLMQALQCLPGQNGNEPSL